MTIPSSVTSIGEWAFGGCSALTSVYVTGDASKLGDFKTVITNDAFGGSDNTGITYYLPYSSQNTGVTWDRGADKYYLYQLGGEWTVAPKSASVEKGETASFSVNNLAATLSEKNKGDSVGEWGMTAIMNPDGFSTASFVEWSVSGSLSSIDANGTLSVASDETASSLTVTAKVNGTGKTAIVTVTTPESSEPSSSSSSSESSSSSSSSESSSSSSSSEPSVPITVPDPTPVITTPKDGWSKNDTVYYENGKKVTGFTTIENETYYFGTDGVKVTGFATIDGDTYYFDDDGCLQTGWLETKDGWYRLDEKTGAMATGWKKVGNCWYYLDTENGLMKTGLQEIGGKTYYFYSWGGMASSWWYERKPGEWYYFRGNGEMAKNAWIVWKGAYYYTGADGKMLTNTTTPDGYRVGENGVWVK